jgi:hypothetical protein
LYNFQRAAGESKDVIALRQVVTPPMVAQFAIVFWLGGGNETGNLL